MCIAPTHTADLSKHCRLHHKQSWLFDSDDVPWAALWFYATVGRVLPRASKERCTQKNVAQAEALFVWFYAVLQALPGLDESWIRGEPPREILTRRWART